MREGLCSKLNTDSGERAGGGSFQGNKVCVCVVCGCAHEPAVPFDLKWLLLNPMEKIYLRSIQ